MDRREHDHLERTIERIAERLLLIAWRLAALSISRGAVFPPNDPTGFEVEKAGAPNQIVVEGAGHWQGEGLGLVEAVK